MNLAKHMDFFDPTQIQTPIHLIGLGAIGSHVACMLTRLGCQRFHLYEFDHVVPHNLANQVYNDADINRPKLEVTIEKMLAINPGLNIIAHPEGYKTQRLSGFVFLCADSIELRRQIVEANLYNEYILAMADWRMRLADAQHYLADWSNEKEKADFLGSMQFSSAEAKAATPVSACGTAMSIIPTVWTITAMGIANFINLVKGEPHRKVILIDSFVPDIMPM